MPVFSFSVKKTNKKVSDNSNRVYKKDSIGIVNISLEGDYYIMINDNVSYKIHPDSYSCVGVSKVYFKFLENNKRVCNVRNEGERFGNRHCLPFAPGCMVLGDIVKNNITDNLSVSYYFKIKKVWTDDNNELCRKALNFYRANYLKIKNNLNGTK